MAQTYKWSDLISVGSAYAKGMPLSKVTPQVADFVSQDMYTEYPWKNTITNTAAGTIPLLDSTQDYTCSAPNIMRPLKAWLERTDVLPHENRDLDIVKDLSVDMFPRSWVGIRAMSLQQAIGLFRLESAVQIPAGTRVELHVEYQIDPIKVDSLGTNCWFDDRFAAVAMEGLLYWVYKLADDPRAGGSQSDAYGRVTGYTGQMGTYKGALGRMKMAEDYGFTDFVVPAEPMGIGRDQNALLIFGW